MKTIELEEMTCCNCGTLFSVEAPLLAIRKKDGGNFTRPNGHKQHFSESLGSQVEKLESEISELKEELHDTQIELRQAKCELMRLSGSKVSFWRRIFKGRTIKSINQTEK